MAGQDVIVGEPPRDDEEGRPDRSLAEQLVEQARADGVDLVGPGGLLAGLTKQVLEAGLEVPAAKSAGPLRTVRRRCERGTAVSQDVERGRRRSCRDAGFARRCP